MKYPYSMGTAVGYSIVLLVSLWWLPVLGPMIIGYITGRKAGGPLKGVIAMFIPIVLYFLIVQAVIIGWIHVPPVIQRYFTTSSFSTTVAGGVFIGYVTKTINTGIEVGSQISNYLYYAPSAFFIMLSFAFIGGAMSKQVILERGLYPEREKKLVIRKERVEVPKTSPKAKKEKKIKNMEREGKFVVHPMDTKKDVPLKPKKKYGITFL